MLTPVDFFYFKIKTTSSKQPFLECTRTRACTLRSLASCTGLAPFFAELWYLMDSETRADVYYAAVEKHREAIGCLVEFGFIRASIWQ
jgi:hypothetical protein